MHITHKRNLSEHMTTFQIVIVIIIMMGKRYDDHEK